MAWPALLAKTAARAAAAAATRRRGGGPGPVVWLLALLLALPLFVAAPFLAVQAGQPVAGCGADAAGSWDGPGSLGGVQGTGITAAELRSLRDREGGSTLPPSLAGDYTATAYAPSLGGINVWNGGIVTAGGIKVNAGQRRAYIVAVDPTVLRLGTALYMWPNPYGWRGPWIAADTGGAILARHIDIYVFGNAAVASATANSWGKRPTRIAAHPIVSGGPPVVSPDPGGCDSAGQLAGGNGKWVLAPFANRPGVGLTADMRHYLDKLASFLSKRLVVCTGTNHSQYTTSGNVSDHWAGNAVDLCSSQNGFPETGGGYGDQIAAAAFRVAGYPPARALAAGRAGTGVLPGGTARIYAGGLRIQIIWKSTTGGDHYNHVHVGVAPA